MTWSTMFRANLPTLVPPNFWMTQSADLPLVTGEVPFGIFMVESGLWFLSRSICGAQDAAGDAEAGRLSDSSDEGQR